MRASRPLQRSSSETVVVLSHPGAPNDSQSTRPSRGRGRRPACRSVGRSGELFRATSGTLFSGGIKRGRPVRRNGREKDDCGKQILKQMSLTTEQEKTGKEMDRRRNVQRGRREA